MIEEEQPDSQSDRADASRPRWRGHAGGVKAEFGVSAKLSPPGIEQHEGRGGAGARTTGSSVLAGGLWNSVAHLVPQGTTLVISVAAARFLGPAGMGRQSFIAFAMLSLTEFVSEGLKLSLTRSVGEALGAGRGGAIRDLMRWASRILFAGGVAGCGVLATAGLAGARPQAAWLLAGLACLLAVWNGAPWALLAGSQRWSQASGVGLITSILSVPATIGVLSAGGGITGMFAVEAVMGAGALLALHRLGRVALRRLPAAEYVDSSLRRRTARYAVAASAMAVAAFVVWQRSELIFLKAYSTSRQIAFYSIAFAAAGAMQLALGPLANSLAPAFATLHGAREGARIRYGYWRAQRLLLLASLPLMAGFVALGPALIELLYGRGYSSTKPVLLIMLSPFPLLALGAAASSLLTGIGVIRAALLPAIAGGAATIALNFALVPRYAATGAALADVGGQLVALVPLVAYASMRLAPMDIDTGAAVRGAAAAIAAGSAAWLGRHALGGAAGLALGGALWIILFAALACVLAVVPARDRSWVLEVLSERLGPLPMRVLRAPVLGVGPAAGRGHPAAESSEPDFGAECPACARLLVYTDATELGGAERALGYLLAALDERIEVWAMGVDSRVIAWIGSQRPGARLVVVPAVRGKWDIRGVLRHVREVIRVRPNVLHAALNSPWSCQYGILAGILVPRTKVVVVENSVVRSSVRRQRILLKLRSRRLAAHVAVGEWAARAIENATELPAGTMSVIHNGVPDRERLRRDAATSGPVIGAVARATPGKRLDLIVQVLADIPSATALIVGDGPDLDELVKLADRLKVSDRVRIVGFDVQIHRRLAEMDVFALPTEEESGVPLAVIEAMLSSLPVVTTSIPPIAEMFPDGEAGLLVPVDDRQRLAEALGQLVGDPALRQRMGSLGRKFALEHFSVTRMARQYEHLYRSLSYASARKRP